MGEAETWWIKVNFSLFVEILMDFFNTEERASFSAAFVFVKVYFSPPEVNSSKWELFCVLRYAVLKQNICSSVSVKVQTHLTAVGRFVL